MIAETLLGRVYDHIIGADSDQLAMAARALVEQDMSVTQQNPALAGSLPLITKEAGLLCVLGSGFVTYANASKQKVLDVPESELNSHGAVSEPRVHHAARRSG